MVRWRMDRGIDNPETLISLEGHGREEQVVLGADLARTVGWFTSIFPVRIDLSRVDPSDAFAGGPAAGVAAKPSRNNSGRCRTAASASGCCAI